MREETTQLEVPRWPSGPSGTRFCEREPQSRRWALKAPRGPKARRDVCSSRCTLAHSLTPSRVRASALALGSGPEGRRHGLTCHRRRGPLGPADPEPARPAQAPPGNAQIYICIQDQPGNQIPSANAQLEPMARCHAILMFDPQREYSSASTAKPNSRCAQTPSRSAVAPHLAHTHLSR